MKKDILERIAELKGHMQAMREMLEEEGIPLDSPEVQDLESFIGDEILFLRSLIKKLETH